MSCCDGCIKYLLFFFNLIFALSGLALIVVGSVFLSNTSSFSELLQSISSGMKTPQVFIIVIGVIIFFIATLGCCGAIKENRCMLVTFAVMLLSIFVMQLAIGIYALTNKHEFRRQVQVGLVREFKNINKNPKTRELFEGMERHMQCCGVQGSHDYKDSVPLSCCDDRSNCKVKKNSYWKTGCCQALTEFTGKAGETVGGVAIGLSFIELVGAIFALRLAIRAF